MNLAAKLSRGQYLPAPHLNLLSKYLVDAAMGREKRIVCEMPPRHGKSQLISRWFPVWFLEMFPHLNVGIITYGADLAQEHGSWVRDTIIENQDYLTVRLRKDRRRADMFMTTAGGSMRALGWGGAIIGKGFHVLIIDDPIKDEQEAYSENEREKKWDEWLNKIRSRIEPDGSCVVLHQRWHTEDLIGRMMKPENQLEKEWTWKRVSFPAIATHPEGTDDLGRVHGEALWPTRFSSEYILSLRTGNEYGWQALYQQDPLIKDGGYFIPSWFGFRDAAPMGTKWIRFWDLAATAKTRKQVDPDYTVGLLLGKYENEYFIGDVVRFRGNPDKVELLVKETAANDGTSVVQWFEEEPGSSGKFVVRNFAKTVLPRHRVKGFKASGPKEAYADVAANRAENGRVHIIGNAEAPPQWTREFLAELQGFPKWAHDDQVDGLSKAIAAHERRLGWGVVSDKERQTA